MCWCLARRLGWQNREWPLRKGYMGGHDAEAFAADVLLLSSCLSDAFAFQGYFPPARFRQPSLAALPVHVPVRREIPFSSVHPVCLHNSMAAASVPGFATRGVVVAI